MWTQRDGAMHGMVSLRRGEGACRAQLSPRSKSERQWQTATRGAIACRVEGQGAGTASKFLGLVRRVAQLDLLDGGIHQQLNLEG